MTTKEEAMSDDKPLDLEKIKKRWIKFYNNPYAKELQSVNDALALIQEVERLREIYESVRAFAATPKDRNMTEREHTRLREAIAKYRQKA